MITNRDILRLNQIFSKLAKEGNPEISYINALNVIHIDKYVKALADANTPKDAFLEFERERVKLLEKHAKKDVDGQVVTRSVRMEDGSELVTYDIDSPAELEAATKDLIEKGQYEPALQKERDRTSEYNALLRQELTEEISLRPYKLSKLGLDINTEDMITLVKHNLVLEDNV